MTRHVQLGIMLPGDRAYTIGVDLVCAATIVPISTIGMQVSHLMREINVAFAVQGVWACGCTLTRVAWVGADMTVDSRALINGFDRRALINGFDRESLAPR